MGKGVKSSREGGSKLESDRREGRCEMRKRLVVGAVVVLAVLLLATPGLVAAKGGHGGGGHGDTWFNITGTITSLDAAAGTIGVDNEITVYTTDDTHFKECDGVETEGI
jgi:hypothetical protein